MYPLFYFKLVASKISFSSFVSTSHRDPGVHQTRNHWPSTIARVIVQPLSRFSSNNLFVRLWSHTSFFPKSLSLEQEVLRNLSCGRLLMASSPLRWVGGCFIHSSTILKLHTPALQLRNWCAVWKSYSAPKLNLRWTYRLDTGLPISQSHRFLSRQNCRRRILSQKN